MSDTDYGTYVCVDCPEDANVHPRKSNRGPAPKRCDAHKEAIAKSKTTARLNELRVASGQKPIEDELDDEVDELDRLEAEAAEENEAATELPPPPPPEKTWLDEAEPQELLRQKREREVATGVPYDPEVHGSVQDYLANASVPVDEEKAEDHEFTAEDYAAATERVNEMRRTFEQAAEPESYTHPDVCVVGSCGMPNPPHAGGFCPNHWQRVGLEERNILLGSEVGGEAFMGAVRRSLVKLG